MVLMPPHHPLRREARRWRPIDDLLSTGVAYPAPQTVLLLSPHQHGLVLPRTMWDLAVPIAGLVKVIHWPMRMATDACCPHTYGDMRSSSRRILGGEASNDWLRWRRLCHTALQTTISLSAPRREEGQVERWTVKHREKSRVSTSLLTYLRASF